MNNGAFTPQRNKLDQYLKKFNHSSSNQKLSNQKKLYLQSVPQTQYQEEQVKMEVFPNKKNPRVCLGFLLLTPKDTVYYQIIQRQLLAIDKNYTQQSFFAYIKKNLSYREFLNIDNLIAIKDQEFYNQILPSLIHLFLQNIGRIACKIRILQAHSNAILQLTRLQILMVLTSMFFGIMPRQFNTSQTTFGEWMTINKDMSKSPDSVLVRRQKLKCLMAYFKAMVKYPSIHSQIVKYQRSCIHNTFSIFRTNLTTKLTNVVTKWAEVGRIQDYYGQCCMVDFSNKNIGGGIMKNGCVQEEILFSIFPQALISRLILDQIKDNEAVTIYGAKRFAKYSGYKLSFKFQGPYTSENYEDYCKSVIIAIDALNFNPKVNPIQENQFSIRSIKREIVKASTGFMSIDKVLKQNMPICTGAWGCGAFHGDEDLKFIIQWIACSIAKKDMMYVSSKAREYSFLVKQIQQLGLDIKDLTSIISQYQKSVFTKDLGKKLSLLDFLKRYVL